jgi:hypothetical protein
MLLAGLLMLGLVSQISVRVFVRLGETGPPMLTTGAAEPSAIHTLST